MTKNLNREHNPPAFASIGFDLVPMFEFRIQRKINISKRFRDTVFPGDISE